jgi:hypothetical protein
MKCASSWDCDASWRSRQQLIWRLVTRLLSVWAAPDGIHCARMRSLLISDINAAEAVVLRKKLRRKEMVAFFEKLAPTVIAIEACGASHHWARLFQSFGIR